MPRHDRERRPVDMSASAEPPPPPWQPPPDEECEESPPYTFAPPGADPDEHRIKVRIKNYQTTPHAMVEFALVQQTLRQGRWRNVAVVDSCHNDEVHLHRYGRRTQERIGEPEQLMPIDREADVQDGYNLAYEWVVAKWAENHRRWQDG